MKRTNSSFNCIEKSPIRLIELNRLLLFFFVLFRLVIVFYSSTVI